MRLVYSSDFFYDFRSHFCGDFLRTTSNSLYQVLATEFRVIVMIEEHVLYHAIKGACSQGEGGGGDMWL